MCCIDCCICHFASRSLIIVYHQSCAQFFSVVYFEGKIVSQCLLRPTMFRPCWYFHPMMVSPNEEASLFSFHCSVLLWCLLCNALSHSFQFLCFERLDVVATSGRPLEFLIPGIYTHILSQNFKCSCSPTASVSAFLSHVPATFILWPYLSLNCPRSMAFWML